MATFLYWLQIISAGLLILAILLQNKAAGLGGAITGGAGGEAFAGQRGVDKLLAVLTVIFAVVFFGGALASIFVR